MTATPGSSGLTPTEAAGLLAWHLAQGETVRSVDAARLTLRGPEASRRLLARLGRVLYLRRVTARDPGPHWCWERPLGSPLGRLQAPPQGTLERAGALAWLLADGLALSNREAARITGLRGDSARQMLCRLSRVLPLVFHRGRWMVLDLLELEEADT